MKLAKIKRYNMVSKEERTLRRLYPGRESFSDAEIEIVRRIQRMDDDVEVPGRCDVVPYVFVPIGGRIRVKGKEYECVRADATLLPAQACSGCALRSGRVQCLKYQCSPFDRSDGRFTWFVEVKDE